MNRATSNRRLLKLADFLDRLPPERFDYGRFVGEGWNGVQDLSCGTTACALGWATTMPEFRRLGLRLKRTRTGGAVFDSTSGELGISAGAEVFGLSFDEAIFLFVPWRFCGPYGWESPGLSATAPEVAAHIRRFVEERV